MPQLYIGLLLTGICEYIYPRLRPTLYKRVFSASIQWPRRIRNWNIYLEVLTAVVLFDGCYYPSQKQVFSETTELVSGMDASL